MNLFTKYLENIKKIIHHLYPEIENSDGITVEFPKDASHGDFSTNAAMVLTKKLKRSPISIAEEILQNISDMPNVISACIAGPGFINFNVDNSIWQDVIGEINIDVNNFSKSSIGNKKKVNLEFVSANPTGPMHIGHARGAVYGDALARILSMCNFDVTKEYYINDAGSQIIKLAQSAFIRYQQALGLDKNIKPGMYPGEYLVKVGERLKSKYSDKLLNLSDAEVIDEIRQFVVDEMMQLIKKDLIDLDIKHDVYISENNDLLKRGLIDKGIKYLKDKGLIYTGVLEKPKGVSNDEWESKEMTLFRAKDFGDDSDRAIIKSDGSYTYASGDIAYHIHKFLRGFNDMILVLGADHIGYIKRMKAIVSAISDGKANIEVAINQLVNLFKNGEPFKMSKRSGNFITVRDVLDEVGPDILRFVMLSKKPDTIIDFDFDKVKEQSKDNPIFYIQYASARASSILRKATEYIGKTQKTKIDISDADKALIKKIAEYPKIIEAAATTLEPHRICNYLYDLATEFHSYWAKGADDSNLRVILENDENKTIFRINLITAFKNIIENGLNLIGVKALEKM